MSLGLIIFTGFVTVQTEFEESFMRDVFVGFIGILAACVLSCVSVKPGEAVAAEVELTILINRDTYIHREPVIVEWSLFNTAKRDLNLCGYIEHGHAMKFSCTDKSGKSLGLAKIINCPKDPQPTPFPQSTTIKGWLDLGWTYELPVGEYTFNALLDTSIFNGWKEIWLGQSKSNEIKFRVEAATGEDEKAVKLMEMTMEKIQSKTSASALNRQEFHEAVISLTDSPRFVPLSNFYLAYNKLGRGELKVQPEDIVVIADFQLQDCIKTTDNPYLKGLARYYLLRTKAMYPWAENDFFPLSDAEKLVQEIQKEHPATYAAQEAPKVLEKLKAARAKKE